MSLMKTLAKVAVGVAVAKGAQSMMKGGGAGGLGDLMGGLGDAMSGRSGGTRGASAGGGLEDMLGSLLGGAAGGKMPGGLGGLLDSLGGAGGASGGGLQNILAGLAGAAGGSLPSSSKARPKTNSADFGRVLNSSFDANPEPEIEPTADQEAAAALMLRAMIQAAKSDGKLDEDEKDRLIGKLGDEVDAEEAAFVQKELQAPVDVDKLIADTPRGLGRQVYAVSVLGINLDHRAEAEYLHKLAEGFGIDPQEVNDIHGKLGVPALYT
jgi:uncharacterized membrane protein YebE (DUF533 family)